MPDCLFAARTINRLRRALCGINMKHDRINTPQFKTELIRKLKNVFPGHEVIFESNLQKGIGFRLRKTKGGRMSDIVRIYRYREEILTKEWLLNSVKYSAICAS